MRICVKLNGTTWQSMSLRPLALGRRVAVCWGGAIRTPFHPRPSIVTATVAAAGTAALRWRRRGARHQPRWTAGGRASTVPAC